MHLHGPLPARLAGGVSRRCYWLSLKRCGKGGPNPTWAGPCPSRNPCSNSLRRGTQPASSSNGRRRRGQARTDREGPQSGLVWCAKLPLVLKHWTVPSGTVLEENVTVLPFDPRGVRWRRLITRADNTDR